MCIPLVFAVLKAVLTVTGASYKIKLPILILDAGKDEYGEIDGQRRQKHHGY